MKSDTANRWLTLGANVGVLLGLILLIIEVRHAIDLSESDAYRNRGTEIQEAMQELALSPDLAAIGVKAQDLGIGSLTKVEFVRWSVWNQATALRMQNQFNDYQLGYLDEASYQAMLRAAATSYPVWQGLGVDMDDFDPKFVQAVVGKRDSRPIPVKRATSNDERSIFTPEAPAGVGDQ
jgi:hypothetical protein